jgi:glycosyltransferase involved in cell wall biosynthesis
LSVVDDGSTDNTADVLAKIFGSRIRLLPLPRRRGAGAARNAGIGLTSGELTLSFRRPWLPKAGCELKVFERFPEAEAVISDSLSSWRDGLKIALDE